MPTSLERRLRRASGTLCLAIALVTPAAAAAVPQTEHLRIPSGRETLDVTLLTPGPGDHPTVVAAAGLGGLFEGNPSKFAARFVAAGYTVVGLDYRYFGSSTGSPRRLVDLKAQVADWRAVIGQLGTIPGVDETHVALWGTSMSGGHVLNIARDYPWLKAVVAQVPHLDSSLAARQLTAPTLLGIAGKVTADLTNAALGLPPVTIPFAGRPNTAAMMTAPGAWENAQANLAVPGTRYVNSTPARSALSVLGYSPIKRATAITSPTYIAAATGDRVAPAAPARRLAARLGAEYVEVAGDHFGVYSGDNFERIATTETQFLDAHLR